jgi:hypothetical protein
MKIATLKQHGQAALIQQDRLYIISTALARHGLLAPQWATLTTLDLLADWRRNLDLLVKRSRHLGSDEHYQVVAEAELDAPVLRPGKMLIAGANHYSHIRQFDQAGGQTPLPPFGQTEGRTFEKSKMAPYLFSKIPPIVSSARMTRWCYPAGTNRWTGSPNLAWSSDRRGVQSALSMR